MADIKAQIDAVRPHLSAQGMHDFIYGNILVETFAYGQDHDKTHMQTLFVWQQELAKVVSELEQTATPAKADAKTPSK